MASSASRTHQVGSSHPSTSSVPAYHLCRCRQVQPQSSEGEGEMSSQSREGPDPPTSRVLPPECYATYVPTECFLLLLARSDLEGVHYLVDAGALISGHGAKSLSAVEDGFQGIIPK